VNNTPSGNKTEIRSIRKIRQRFSSPFFQTRDKSYRCERFEPIAANSDERKQAFYVRSMRRKESLRKVLKLTDDQRSQCFRCLHLNRREGSENTIPEAKDEDKQFKLAWKQPFFVICK